MNGVLVDTATMLDLLLYCQPRKGRARSISSSAGAAVEALVLYNVPVVDGPSFAGLVDNPRTTRYLEYYCDDPATVANQVRDLSNLCGLLDLSWHESVAAYSRGLELFSATLAEIEDPDDLRAYDLYDYLPYHLGEDSTAIECHVMGRSVANLEDLLGEFPADIADVMGQFCGVLRERGHPTRAAWILPILRMLYYESVQASKHLHYAPHATKATLRFGRPEESIRSRRLLDYCRPGFRADYLRRESARFANREVSIPVPNVAVQVLDRPVSWDGLLRRIATVRASAESSRYRSAVADFLDFQARGGDPDEEFERLAEVEAAVRGWQDQLPLAPVERRVAIASPLFFPADGPRPTVGPLTLVHPLLPGC